MENFTEKLKSCPYCGGKAEYKDFAPDIIDMLNIYQIECADCGIYLINNVSEEEAIEAWNPRVEPKNVVARYVYNNCIRDIVSDLTSDLSPLRDNGKTYVLTITREES